MKKILVIFACFLFVFVGAFGVTGCDTTKNMTHAEVDGIVFDVLQREARNYVLKENDNEDPNYLYHRFITVELSLTNNRATPFSFMADSLKFTVNGEGYGFKFARMLGSEELIDHKSDYITLPANTQTTFRMAFADYYDFVVGKLSNEERMESSIEGCISRDKMEYGTGKVKAVMKYLGTTIANFEVGMSINNVGPLMQIAKGITIDPLI